MLESIMETYQYIFKTILKSEGNFHVVEPRRDELPFNDC